MIMEMAPLSSESYGIHIRSSRKLSDFEYTDDGWRKFPRFFTTNFASAAARRVWVFDTLLSSHRYTYTLRFQGPHQNLICDEPTNDS